MRYLVLSYLFACRHPENESFVQRTMTADALVSR